jgi:glycosyltransferase involved in cell wall biosynthesis
VMRIAIIADAYSPMRTSGAVQLRDLAGEFLRQGHLPLVLVPAFDISQPFVQEQLAGVNVLRIKAPRTKDVGYVRRALAEFLMPYAMLRGLRDSPYGNTSWDGIVWYSPSIFHGPMVRALKRRSACRSYLILRDIFPEWAVDMGLMGRGLPYQIFKMIERYQYSVADVIGVQTPGNLGYFKDWAGRSGRHVDVLQNWLAAAPQIGCSISVSDTSLAGRKIFVYAGNMGVAQGMGVLLDLAARLKHRSDIGFLFVGRGSDAKRLQIDALKRNLDNVVFFDEIDPNEIPGLYAQCQIGLVALDPRHTTHNVPGKFLSYMHSGLPVLAIVNPGNDLVELIKQEQVGRVCTTNSVGTIAQLVELLIADLDQDEGLTRRCKALATKLFSPELAAKQIAAALESA